MKRISRYVSAMVLGCAFALLCASSSLAAIEFDSAAIEAEVAAAVAAGEDPTLAAKNAIAEAVKVIVAANENYPGGTEALNAAILDAIGGLSISGIDAVDALVAANYALGLSTDPALEAYQAPGAGPGNHGQQGRDRARNQNGHAYGPGGKPANGSPT